MSDPDFREFAPRFCPACGARLPHDDNAIAVYENGAVLEASFDTYCPTCDWSGDIEPDAAFVYRTLGDDPARTLAIQRVFQDMFRGKQEGEQ